MKLANIAVQNYRGLREVSLPLSRFACFIGKNNAGKSTILQAISLFFSGTKLGSRDFFDCSQPIRIEIRFEDISSADLSRLADEHRTKIESIVTGGKLSLVRRYDTSGGSKLMYVALAPKEERFSSEKIAAMVKGQKGAALVAAAVAIFPELEGKLTNSVSQTKIKEEIQLIADGLPLDCKELADVDLPTGIDSSIKALLPDPIYIPAVKNLADDVKAKESTPFGKVLGILLDAIEPQLGDVKKFFTELTEKFNRVTLEDGKRSDKRLPEVQAIEQTVESFLRQSFANVSLEITIPPPELSSILSSAEMLIDDGVQGPIESKGDGLRRAAVFAVLRSYVKLMEPGALGGNSESTVHDRHILLFEEPELYLHPSAQKVLFDALSVFSRNNHVLITTHSPSFFGPSGTASFVKLSKVSNPTICSTPFTVARPVDLSEVKAKDQFQLICFENNNAAFFFDSVVLVEGDSDYIVLPHVAQLLIDQWDSVGSQHRFVKINGKGSIKRYKEFFSKFDVRVAVVTDLDLLTNGFKHIEPSTALKESHSRLCAILDRLVVPTEAGVGKVKEAQSKTELLGKWKYAKALWADLKNGKGNIDDCRRAVDDFFAWESNHARLKLLMESTDAELLKAKRELLHLLRSADVFVLERGELEAYYPADLPQGDKPTRAQEFCNRIKTRDEVLALCCDCEVDGINHGRELSVICKGLFHLS